MQSRNKSISGLIRKTAALIILTALMISSLLPAALASSGDSSGPAVSGMTDGDILYSENFDGIPDGTLPEGYRLGGELKEGGAEVRDGRLVIKADGISFGKVLLPDVLDGYGNYSVEADISFLSTANDSRWMSVVVRQQETDENYYHMCVRRASAATNGIEFASRTPGEWNIYNTAPAQENAGLNREVHVKISICDGIAAEYFNGEEIIFSQALNAYRNYLRRGAVGFQANNSTITVDNVVVRECSYVETGDGYVNKYYMTDDFLRTTVIASAATVAELTAESQLDELLALEKRPESIILYVDAEGSITSPDGSASFGGIEEITEKLLRKMMPVYSVSDADGADALVAYLKSARLFDCMVMSENAELVAKVRKSRQKIGGIIDFRNMPVEETGREKLLELVFTANRNSAKTVLIPEWLASKDNVEYMQHRLITVWTAESAGPEDAAMLHNSIQSGANAIVTDTPKELIEAYSFYSGDAAVLVRNPMVIGHRGLLSAAPENSIESAKEAVKAGVDCIELDVRLSKDGEIYIYHDGDLSSLTTGSGSVNSRTAAEIDSFRLLKSSGYGTFEAYPEVKIPTLRAFFEALKDCDVMFFVEIKESANNISGKVADMIREFGFEDRCCIITFLSDQVTAFQAALPGMSTGQLMSTPAGTNYEDVMQDVISAVGPENATFNANNVYDARLVKALMYRGITSWPWTYTRGNTADAYLMGAGGITTDTCDAVSLLPVRIDIGGGYEYTLNLSEGSNKLTYSPVVYNRVGVYDTSGTYSSGAAVAKPELTVIEGGDCISIDGNTITAVKNGTARLMYRLTASVIPGEEPGLFTEYTIYTQVITVTVDSEAEVDPGTLPAAKPDAALRKKTVLITSLTCAGIIAAAGVLLAFAANKKNGKQHRENGEEDNGQQP